MKKLILRTLFIFSILIILFIVFFATYKIFIFPELTTNDSITNIQTKIYWGQLFVGLVLGIGAIGLAYKQIKISDKQIELSKRQLQVETIKFAISTKIINKNELIEAIKNTEYILSKTDDNKTIEDIKRLKNNKLNANRDIDKLKIQIKEHIEEYNNMINDNYFGF